MATEWGRELQEKLLLKIKLGKQRSRRSKSIHVGKVITEVNLNPKEKQALACRWLTTRL